MFVRVYVCLCVFMCVCVRYQPDDTMFAHIAVLSHLQLLFTQHSPVLARLWTLERARHFVALGSCRAFP